MSRHELITQDTVAGPDDDLHQTISAVREAVVEREEQADARATDIVDSRARRYWLPRIALSSAAAAALAVIVVLILIGPVIADLRSGADVQAQTTDELRRLVESSAQAGDEANDELAARGLPTVPISEPGTAPDSEVIVDAATAQVLAALPAQAAARGPTAGELAVAIAGYFADNPVVSAGPTAAQVAAALAEFLAANPPPAGQDGADGTDGQDGADGEDGAMGERGPPPTAEEIQVALAVFLADNPNVLCPRGGTYALVENVATLDGPRDFWVCVLPSTSPVEPDGGDTGTGNGGGAPDGQNPDGLLGGLVG